MEINVTSKIIECGKCGSRDIGKPVNDEFIIFQCNHCGHKKLRITQQEIGGQSYTYKQDSVEDVQKF